ncbi:MAG: hypothetical protein OEZ36_14065, partial [Spirochaetota bacterium]|nr:hypothetical protein [Spirochaetota bacterium]
MNKLISRFIYILLFLLTASGLSAGNYETLIDFSRFEAVNNLNKAYAKDDEKFRKKVYQKTAVLSEGETIAYNGSFLPWFRVTAEDMSLNRWVIRYIYPSGQRPVPARHTKGRVTVLDKAIKQTDRILSAKIYFPNRLDSLSASISPPYDIHVYDRKGRMTNEANGVLNNVGEIEQISARLGFQGGNTRNIAIHINLSDHRGAVWSYPMGFLHSGLHDAPRYYNAFDGKEF